MTFKFNMGDRVKDKITGFEGIAMTQTDWIDNSNTYSVKPKGLKDGKSMDSEVSDEGMLELVEEKEIEVVPVREFEFNIGDRVKDNVNHYEGIITARTHWMTGCNNYGVKSMELKDGKPVGLQWLSEVALEIVKVKEKKVKASNRGGPTEMPQHPNR